MSFHFARPGSIPPAWAAASIQLLAKSAKLSDPSEFRPITLTNTIGKIFFSVIARRLEKFMLANKYITDVQKGFKAKTPGCLEHSFAMFEAMLDAKMHQRQIVVSWLDLKNAFGSVRHNLIQFALNWYHVPEVIRRLIRLLREDMRGSPRERRSCRFLPVLPWPFPSVCCRPFSLTVCFNCCLIL
jgi:hypothetical protein